MPDRKPILEILNKMPDEAFSYVVLACKAVVEQNEANHGFLPASTRSFVELALAVNAYVGGDLIDMKVVQAHNPTLFPPASTGAHVLPSTETVIK